MKYLIATQILIWYQINSKSLSNSIKEIINSNENEIYVSDVSLLEIAIKKKINKLLHLGTSINDIIEVAEDDNFNFIPIRRNLFSTYDTLPLLADHRDPFDRLIICKAIEMNLILISFDEKFSLYRELVKIISA
jgi:PIN domain nuclease of toxin-antitoxin system